MDQLLKFISYNLQWSKTTKDTRVAQFLELVKKEEPDVIVLQNINVVFFEKLGREMGYIGYKKYFPDNFQQRSLSDIIFIKNIIAGNSSTFIEFQKNTDKKGIFLLEIQIQNKKICVCTAQIDKLPYLQTYQLNNINKLLEGYISNNPIILGIDTNAPEYLNINKIDGWYDAWYECGVDSEKYTLDSTRNTLAPEPFFDRPDRVLFKSKDGELQCEKFKLIGMDYEISPHYGIMCMFSF